MKSLKVSPVPFRSEFPSEPLSPGWDRKAGNSILLNAFLWGIGNGLISTSLIIYLIRDICSGLEGVRIQTAIAWIIAAPRIAGLFRLLAPTAMQRLGSRKWFLVACYAFSPITLLAIPLGIPRMMHESPIGNVLAFLALIWCVYHLIEYLGGVAFWSLIGDLVPQENRGRFLGFREASKIFGQTLSFICCGLYSYYVIDAIPHGTPKWTGYLLPTYFGICALFLSVVPLLKIPEIPWNRESRTQRNGLWEIFRPLRSRRFLLLLLFGIWLQLPGLMQSVQQKYQIFVLQVPLLAAFSREMITRLGQSGLGPRMGRWMDRFGYFRIMGPSIAVVSTGSLFYFFAEPSSWWLIYGAAGVWIFWVGVNIGSSALVLNLAPEGQKANAIALYYTASTLTFAICTLSGGYLADLAQDWTISLWFFGKEHPMDYAHYGFLCSFALRLTAILPLYRALKSSQ